MIEAISDVLDKRCITLDIRGKRKPEIVSELVQLLADAGYIEDPSSITDMVLQREGMMSTGIGGGIAVPHCLAPGVEETMLAFGRHRKGAKFDSVDKKPVQLFFLMIGPPGAHTEHLRLLSKLSRLLHDETLKRGLIEAHTPEDVMKLFAVREGRGDG
ncbi:MAG: PTS sugar transporter subunit IIA [Alkalispirochaeta sp.]